MINGTTGVFADRGGVIEHIPLDKTCTAVERLEAAIQRVARMMGQDLTHQNPILNTRMPDGSRVWQWSAHHQQSDGPSVSPSANSISGSRPTSLIEKGSMPQRGA